MSGLIQSTDADYERVPVEAYGLAMLKGMGWKQGEGIGLTFKQQGPFFQLNKKYVLDLENSAQLLLIIFL